MAEIHFEEVDNTAENMTDEEKQMRKVQGEIDLLKKVASESLEKVRYLDKTMVFYYKLFIYYILRKM